MRWCEGRREVHYCVGPAKNSVFMEEIQPAPAGARARHCLTGATTRRFCEFEYQTIKSWSRARRGIGKAEVSAQGDNPRFLVTHLPSAGFPGDEDATRFLPQRLYEELYCARGRMENMLQQQTLDLAADRMIPHHLASNPLRLWWAAFAYLLLERVRALVTWAAYLASTPRV